MTSFAKIGGKTVFAVLTLDDLIKEFGGRQCKSLKLPRDNEKDPRGTRTYPLTTSRPVEV